ncbi:MAG TPA: ribokinase [Clostridiales bacterium]|nr:ribokinase [Clostridiales bacterium]
MIYVLGSINMDMVARVPRMPVGGETLTADKYYVNPGGKGANQAVAIAKLGGKVAMIGKVGSDETGDALKNNLKAMGVDESMVTRADVPSGIAMIIVEGGENRIILYKGANHSVTKADVDEGLKNAKPGDALVMQLEIPLETVTYAAAVAKQKGMLVLLNPAPAVPLGEELLKNVDIIAPNETETEILTGVGLDSDVHIALAVKKLYQLGVKRVIITMGSRGSIVAEGQTITPVEPRKVKAVDTTSAGDTFVGATVLRYLDGDTLEDAARFASVASSITVTREGAAQSIPTLEEVKKVIESEK